MTTAYVPSAVAAYTFGILYGIAALGFIVHIFYRRAWWALCLPIGAAFVSGGFFMRLPLRNLQTNSGLFTGM